MLIKRKILTIMISTILLLNIMAPNKISAYGEDYDFKYIKVGLNSLSSKTSVSLSGNSFLIGKVDESFKGFANIQEQNMVAKISNFRYYIKMLDKIPTYQSALERVNRLKSQNIQSKVGYSDGFEVWIGEFSDKLSAESYKNTILNLVNEQLEVSQSESLINLEKSNGENIISFDTKQEVYIKTNENIITVENKKYRDCIGFNVRSGKLIVINNIELGNYLKGVVPREMPASWELEALKAQAVSARNYTIKNIGKHKNEGFDICDTTHCQVYGGYDGEHPNSNRAIDETKGKVLMYNGELADTYYYSCSGGYTANNEEVWNGSPVPYLRAKEDIYSKDTPHSNWTYTLSKSEFNRIIKSKGYDVGDIISVETKKDSVGARVVELVVKGTNGERVILKDNVRAIFGYNNIKSTNYIIEGASPSNPVGPTPPTNSNDKTEVYILSADGTHTIKEDITNLTVISSNYVGKINTGKDIVVSNGSNNKVIKYNKDVVNNQTTGNINDSILIGENITFRGKGFGHGVGMSQYGAQNMAKQGYRYNEILEFYYTGTKVE